MIFSEKMLVISQIHRSGGTLLSQLFDSHSEMYCHPGELEIWKPKPIWGQSEPFVQFNPKNKSWEECFHTLQQERLTEFSNNKKFNKPGLNSYSVNQTFDFSYSELEHKVLFKKYFTELTEVTRANVVMCYMQSLFHSWNQVENESKKYITSFVANMWCDPISMLRFFQDFGDAKVIFLLRSPDSWLQSAMPHRGFKTDDVSAATCLLEYWMDSVRNLYNYLDLFGTKIVPIIYEDLTSDTERVMKKLCEHLDLKFESCLLSPTFLGKSIYANSSFEIKNEGIIPDKSRTKPSFIPKIQNKLYYYMNEYEITSNAIRKIYYK
jgi:hypothetical protein